MLRKLQNTQVLTRHTTTTTNQLTRPALLRLVPPPSQPHRLSTPASPRLPPHRPMFSNIKNSLQKRLNSDMATKGDLREQQVAKRRASVPPQNIEFCTVASGCFWGTEQIYRKHFMDKGIIDIKVGFTRSVGDDTAMGGGIPSYRAVCSGRTRMAEAVRIEFDNSKVGYEKLIEFFYRTHDPTTKNAQGNDHGSQYRSGIYWHSKQQEAIAFAITSFIDRPPPPNKNPNAWVGRSAGRFSYEGDSISTEIAPAGKWFDAEDEHQDYLNNNPHGYHCYTHVLRDFPPLDLKTLRAKALEGLSDQQATSGKLEASNPTSLK